MKKTMRSTVVFLALGGLAVFAVMFVGCKKDGAVDSDDSTVLLTIRKKPVIREEGFHKELGAMAQNVDARMLPLATKRKVLDDLAKFETKVQLAKDAGIEKDSEFLKVYNEQADRLKKLTMVRFYDKKKFDSMSVSDQDSKEFFDKNKERFVKEQGGVLVSGVSFGSRDKALAFYEKVKGKENVDDFASVGKKEKDGKFREFGRVSKEAMPGAYNFVPVAVKTAAQNLTKLPGVDLVKDGKDTWVIHVSDKKEAFFFEYPEIADRIKNQLKVNKFMEASNKEYEEAKSSLGIEINEEYFKEAPQPVAPGEGASVATGEIPTASDDSQSM